MVECASRFPGSSDSSSHVTFEETALSLSKSCLRLLGWLLGLLVLQEALRTPGFASTPVGDTNRPATSSESGAVTNPLAYYHFLLGYEHYLANDLETALAEFDKALSFDPGSTVLRLRLAVLFQARGEHAKAQSYAEQVLARDPADVQALQILATIAGVTGHSEQAIDYYRRII
ncbi:MAG: tetratricopeptide repeat protein, partial [Nitrospirota bacterium]